jgi:hypothetical protein
MPPSRHSRPSAGLRTSSSGNPEPPLVRDGRDRPLQSLLRDKEGVKDSGSPPAFAGVGRNDV